MANWYWYETLSLRTQDDSPTIRKLLYATNDNLTCYRYGFHVPRTNARDNFYSKLEDKRASENAQSA